MTGAILPTSLVFSRAVHVEPTDNTRFFQKKGTWELRSVDSCARDMNRCTASEKSSRAWVYSLILPLSQKSEKNKGYRELTTLVCSERRGSMGGSNA